MSLIVITKNDPTDPQGYEWPDVYIADTDGAEYPRERAEDILKQLHQNYLKTEEKESAIPIDLEHSYCNRSAGYGQIAWENGDIHQYFLVDDVQRAAEVLKEYSAYQGKVTQEDPETKGQASSYQGNQILSLSTVHVHPDAVDFLSVPMSSDALQVFPNSDQCVVHVADADAVGRYDVPSSVKDCIRYADKHGCSWIHFSYEGDEDIHLPTYRTAWDKVM